MANRYYHELASDHPINFFNEIYLTPEEYAGIGARFDSLPPVTAKWDNLYRVNILQLRRSHAITDLAETMKALFPYFWIHDPARYLPVARLKMRSFVQNVAAGQQLEILDGGLVQFFTDGLLLNGFSKSFIVGELQALLGELQDLHPFLIYFSPSDIEGSIRQTFAARGEVYKVGRHFPYAQGKEKDDLQLYVDFLTDYHDIAREFVTQTNGRKLAVDNSNREWTDYERDILRQFGVEPVDAAVDPIPFASLTGEYGWQDKTFTITWEQGTLYASYNTYKKRLIPKSETEWYISDNSVELHFVRSSDADASADSFTIGGSDISQDWSRTGTQFVRNRTGGAG
ncbi:hypothetical protein [Paenibacillus sacheonensis]|uniref:Uncharacterized protein n=1 Tax=Paenibacillus sacheonensis TaxID=742054 RepID=A0A7X5C3I2_9BACL|nr:hypothetical protein [Paenibacillus sacheonensis]MBM7568552.1 hypothetical protein [Paenibacillus sacheonensis]NBC72375.1 hypothetical protein [Paenibacillus sacheonensis]